ncbi:MAG: hypothetical protein IIW96_01475, partial [Oscillibacter sp.]|nr:hypothetical protein [Oscillibacter sp.]
IKVGTSTLTYENGKMNFRRIERLCKVLCDLHNSGEDLLLVSSGAVGVGMGKTGLSRRPEETKKKQALAAIGQCELMFMYDKFFGEYNHNIAQILLTAQQTDNFGMQTVDAGLESGSLALGLDDGIDFLLSLCHHLLDVGGMDTAVGNEFFQSQAGDLAADGLEAGDGNGLGGIIDDQVHTGEGLDGADVAALAADDAALHLVIGQGNHADGHFSHLVGGTALDGLGHHFAGAGLALFLHAGLHFLDLQGSLVGDLGLHLGDQVLLGLLGSETGDALQHFGLAALDDLDLLGLLVDGGMLLVEGLFLLLDGVGLAVQSLFLLLQAVFLPLQISSAGLFFLLKFAAAFQDLFFGFQQGLALFGLSALIGLVDDALGFFLSAFYLPLRIEFPPGTTEKEAHRATRQQADDGSNDRVHGLLLP